MRPPAQFGVGGPFQQAGIPQIGAIAGPEYLLTISDNGELDKLDEHLAARQIAWIAEIARGVDKIDRAALREGDPTLGGPAPQGNIEPSSVKPAERVCAPRDKRVSKRHRRRKR
jgi:hypothetical protein